MPAWPIEITMDDYFSVLWCPGELRTFLLVHHEALTISDLRQSDDTES